MLHHRSPTPLFAYPDKGEVVVQLQDATFSNMRVRITDSGLLSERSLRDTALDGRARARLCFDVEGDHYGVAHGFA
jgi:hypothetical protein